MFSGFWGDSTTWQHLDRQEGQSLIFIEFVSEQITLWQQKTIVLQWPGGVFCISMKMRFVKILFFWGRQAHSKRRQVADMVISQAGAWPGHGQIRKKLFVVEDISLTWAGAFSRLSYAGALSSAQDGGPRPLPKVQNWATQKNPDFGKKLRPPVNFFFKNVYNLNK